MGFLSEWRLGNENRKSGSCSAESRETEKSNEIKDQRSELVVDNEKFRDSRIENNDKE